MAVVLLPLLFVLLTDLTGLWYGPPPATSGNKRDLYVALRVTDGQLTGEIESPTRVAPISEVSMTDSGFHAVAAHDWDGKPVRRPIEAQLQGDVLHLSVQGWPGGPMQAFELKRISSNPVVPRPAKIPAPTITSDLPYNGLAKTPPMGWNSWNKFGCRVDASMIREMADTLVSSGMRDARYVYVNIDDCWQAEKRASNGTIQADPKRFPDMKGLADYVHGKGLKLGIYSSPGPRTCAGFEGSYGHEEQDARQFAAWGIDLLKYDWCSAGKFYSESEMRAVYWKMGGALQATGRPILYSLCQYGLAGVEKWGPLVGGNSWRSTTDIGDNWKSIEQIGFVEQVGKAAFSGPGRWNDPDMLEVGNGGMSATEYRTHFSLWALLAAPLLAGNDIRTMPAETRAVLLNRDVIAVDQDALGRQADRRWKEGDAEVWSRPLADGSWAVGVFNRNDKPRTVRFEWTEAGLPGRPLAARDLWSGAELQGELSGEYSGEIAGHGVVLLRVRF